MEDFFLISNLIPNAREQLHHHLYTSSPKRKTNLATRIPVSESVVDSSIRRVRMRSSFFRLYQEFARSEFLIAKSVRSKRNAGDFRSTSDIRAFGSIAISGLRFDFARCCSRTTVAPRLCENYDPGWTGIANRSSSARHLAPA